jgi:hypothetical protein
VDITTEFVLAAACPCPYCCVCKVCRTHRGIPVAEVLAKLLAFGQRGWWRAGRTSRADGWRTTTGRCPRRWRVEPVPGLAIGGRSGGSEAQRGASSRRAGAGPLRNRWESRGGSSTEYTARSLTPRSLCVEPTTCIERTRPRRRRPGWCRHLAMIERS